MFYSLQIYSPLTQSAQTTVYPLVNFVDPVLHPDQRVVPFRSAFSSALIVCLFAATSCSKSSISFRRYSTRAFKSVGLDIISPQTNFINKRSLLWVLVVPLDLPGQ